MSNGRPATNENMHMQLLWLMGYLGGGGYVGTCDNRSNVEGACYVDQASAVSVVGQGNLLSEPGHADNGCLPTRKSMKRKALEEDQPFGERESRRHLNGFIAKGKTDYCMFAKEASLPTYVPRLGISEEVAPTSIPMFMTSLNNTEKIAIAACLTRPAKTNDGTFSACSIRSAQPCQSVNRVQSDGRISQNLFPSSNSLNPALLHINAIQSASDSNFFSSAQMNIHVETTQTSSSNLEPTMRHSVYFSSKNPTIPSPLVGSPLPTTPSQSQISSTEGSVDIVGNRCDSVIAQKERALLSQRRPERLKFASDNPHSRIDQTSDSASPSRPQFALTRGNNCNPFNVNHMFEQDDDMAENDYFDQVSVAQTNVAVLPQKPVQSMLNDCESKDFWTFAMPRIEGPTSTVLGFSFQRLISGDLSMLDQNDMDDDDDKDENEESVHLYLEYYRKLKADEEKLKGQQKGESNEGSKSSIYSTDSNTFARGSEHVAECDDGLLVSSRKENQELNSNTQQSFGNSPVNILTCEKSLTEGEQSLLLDRYGRPIDNMYQTFGNSPSDIPMCERRPIEEEQSLLSSRNSNRPYNVDQSFGNSPSIISVCEKSMTEEGDQSLLSSRNSRPSDNIYQNFGNSYSNIPICERSLTEGDQSLLSSRNCRSSDNMYQGFENSPLNIPMGERSSTEGDQSLLSRRNRISSDNVYQGFGNSPLNVSMCERSLTKGGQLLLSSWNSRPSDNVHQSVENSPSNIPTCDSSSPEEEQSLLSSRNSSPIYMHQSFGNSPSNILTCERSLNEGDQSIISGRDSRPSDTMNQGFGKSSSNILKFERSLTQGDQSLLSSRNSRPSDNMYQSFGNLPINILTCERSSNEGDQSLLSSRNTRPSVSGRTLCSELPWSDVDQNTFSEVSENFHRSSKGAYTPRSAKPESKVSEQMALKEVPVTTKLLVATAPKSAKLESKVSKQIASKEAPATAKALVATGLLEGQRVRYLSRGGEVFLTGVICNSGVLCNCRICKGKHVVNLSVFERHAGSAARHPSYNIYLENGKTLRDILEACWLAPKGEVVGAILGAVNSFGEDKGTKRCSLCGDTCNSSSAQCMKENCTYASHPACIGAFQQTVAPLRCSKCVIDAAQKNKSEITSVRTQESTHSSHMEKSPLRSTLVDTQVGQSEKLIIRNEQTKQLDHRENRSVRIGQAIRLNQSRDMSLHKLIFLPGALPDDTELAYYVKGQEMLKGVKHGSGICCSCCNQVVSCTQFETHAGWSSRRNPYNSIFLSDGRSLHDVAVEISLQREEQTHSDNLPCTANGDVCSVCGDGGNLVLCDGCSQAYHTDCAGISKVPDGDWFCYNCTGSIRRLPVRHAGRGFAKLMKEELQGRCQRVVKASENSGGGCVICRNGDFLKAGFGDKTIMLCDQCEQEYHVGCLKEKGLADLKELPPGDWFCGEDCNRMHATLQCLVRNGAVSVDTQISRPVLEQQQLKSCMGETTSGSADFSWQLLHGKSRNPDDIRILAEAEAIFMESFDPIVDASSGRSLIPFMVSSRSFRDQDFSGMYCAVLKWNGCVVSAVIFRVFGRRFAEMPLVATRVAYRRQGFFQILHSCLEWALGFLQVERLIVPAAEGAEAIWINKCNFSKLQEDELQQLNSQQVQIMIFQGSSMLWKCIPPKQTLPGTPF